MNEHYPVPFVQAQPTGQAATLNDPGGLCSTLVSLATIGAVVGASAAGGANILRLQREEVTATEALSHTGKAALAGAAATAVAGAAASAVANEGLTRIAVLLAAGTAVMYGLQRRWALDEHLESDQ